MEAVERLPKNVRNKIASDLIITNASQCVLELVYNSLDAGASSIAVRINLQKFYIQVVDDASGISYENLSVLGNRYMSNKCVTIGDLEGIITTYGYRGCAIASMIDCCGSVEIQTRPENSSATFIKVMKKGEANEITEKENYRPIKGTTVIISDFMASKPVRRNMIKEVFDIEDIKIKIEALSVFHYNVSFSLRNDTSGKVIFQSQRKENVQYTLAEIFDLAINKLLLPISLQQDDILVTGFISHQLHSDTSLQLIYVNKRIIDDSKCHKLVIALSEKHGNYWKEDKNDSSIIDINGYVFIINIQLPYPNFSLFQSGRKTFVEFHNEKNVLKCLYHAVMSVMHKDQQPMDDKGKPDALQHQIGNPNFGPSQLQNVVHGTKATRVNQKVTQQTQNIEPCSNLSNHSVDFFSNSLERSVVSYREKFFNESGAEGTRLAINAPIFEVPGIPQVSFHEFLAWLKIKAKKSHTVQSILKEYIFFKAGKNNLKSVECKKIQKAQNISLKEIRREKLAMKTKLVIKRLSGATGGATESKKRKTMKGEPRIIYSVKSRTEYRGRRRILESSGDALKNMMAFRNIPLTSIKENIPMSGTPVESPLCTWKSHYNQKFPEENNDFLNKHVQLTPERESSFRKESLGEVKIEPLPYISSPEKNKKLSSLLIEDSSEHMLPEMLVECAYIDPLPPQGGCDFLTRSNDPVDIYSTPKINRHDKIDLRTPRFGYYELGQSSKCGSTEMVCKEIQTTLETADKSVQNSPKFFQNKAVQTTESYKGHAFTQTSMVGTKEAATDYEQISVQLTDSSSYNFEDSETYHKFLEQIKLAETGINQKKDDFSLNDNRDRQLGDDLLDADKSQPDTIPHSETQWEERRTNSGKAFFVHSVSGFTSFNPPLSSTKEIFPMQNKPVGIVQNPNPAPTIPPLSAAALDEMHATLLNTNEEYLLDVKWESPDEGGSTKPKYLENLLDQLSEMSCQNFDVNVPSAAIEGPGADVHRMLTSFQLNRDVLMNAKVLGQLDKKFIVALIGRPEDLLPKIIAVFDQHAVDERIKLQKLLRKYQRNGSLEGEVLAPPFIFQSKATTIKIIQSQIERFEDQGLSLEFLNNNIKVLKAPVCFMEKHKREVKAYRESSLQRLIENLIEEIVEHLKDTRGIGLTMPKSVMNVIATEACHGAIKFNEALTKEKMEDMLKELNNCQLPFQCAHGRPSVVPLIDLNDTEKENIAERKKLHLRKFKKSIF